MGGVRGEIGNQVLLELKLKRRENEEHKPEEEKKGKSGIEEDEFDYGDRIGVILSTLFSFHLFLIHTIFPSFLFICI